jgi:alpha-glucoside transport system substrate-binding protein
MTSMGRRVTVATVAACLVIGAACAAESERGSAVRDLRGQKVEIVAVWQDVEAARFERVLTGFEEATGADVTFTSTSGDDIASVLDARIEAGAVPDLALLPQPGLLRRYAREGVIIPIDAVIDDATIANWSSEWRDLGSVDGRLYALWFKAAHKSLVWYRIAAFERAGVVPPSDLDGLVEVAEAVVATGTPAFAISGGDQWTYTDWFENLYLRLAGPDRYDALAERRLPWTDPSVVDTLTLMGRLLSARNAAGGPDGVAATSFPDSVALVFDGDAGPAMVVEGDFVAGMITGSTEAKPGVDADVFAFPDADPARRLVVGGGDAVAMLRDTPVARALVAYLATPAAAERWAREGGFVSPNEDVDLAVYPDEIGRAIARSLIEAGDGFRFDLSDLQAASFGSRSGEGMQGILASFLADPSDPALTARDLEAAAQAADVTEPAGPGERATPRLPIAVTDRPPTRASSAGGATSS